MRNVRGVVILLVALIYATSLSAQNGEVEFEKVLPKKVQWIAKGGVNFSALSAIIDSKRRQEKSKMGYHLGFAADIKLSNSFYIQPGLNVSAKGSKLREMETTDGDRVDLSMNAIYIQAPVFIVLKQSASNKYNNFLNVAGGPYFAYGIGGKISGPITSNLNTFGAQGLLKNFDAGIAIELQFEMPKVLFYCGSELGLANVVKKEYLLNDISFNNRNLYIGMGYKF